MILSQLFMIKKNHIMNHHAPYQVAIEDVNVLDIPPYMQKDQDLRILASCILGFDVAQLAPFSSHLAKIVA